MEASLKNMEAPLHHRSAAAEEELACLAYGLWFRAGRPSGRDLEFWLEAERLVSESRQTPAAKPASEPSLASRTSAEPAPTQERINKKPSPPVGKPMWRHPGKSAARSASLQMSRTAPA